jgi:two-component system, cell cycle sensor histidine kinase and response regulator CckA
MPRKGGKDACREMRRRKTDLKVVFMSGYTNNAVHQSFVWTPGVPFMSKPFSAGDLARKGREVPDRSYR